MSDVPSALPKSARLRGDVPASSEEPERSAMAKLAAMRAQAGWPADPEADEPPGLEERLWAALGRAVSLLEARLDALESSDVTAYIGDKITGETEGVRSIAEALDRLGMLKLPPGLSTTRPPRHARPLDQGGGAHPRSHPAVSEARVGMSERLHEPTEVADLRAKLEAAEGRIERARAPRESRRRAASSATRSWSASAVRTANTSWEPSPTGDGAEEKARQSPKGDDGQEFLGRPTGAAQSTGSPDWQALAGELAEDLTEWIKRSLNGLGPSSAGEATDEEARVCSPALARYHEAIAQHSGEKR